MVPVCWHPGGARESRHRHTANAAPLTTRAFHKRHCLCIARTNRVRDMMCRVVSWCVCVCVCVCRVCAVLLVRCCDASRLHLAQFASGHVLLRSAPHHIIVLSLLLLLCLPCSARSQRLNTRRMPRKQSGISASFEYDHSHYHCLLPCWFSGDSRGGGQVTRRDNHMPPSC